jgi:hypothetical protein
MTDRPRLHDERPSAAPELHNAEQDDEPGQAQTVAREAGVKDAEASPLDSTKAPASGDAVDDSSQDLIDRMRDMEKSGRIDMGAYRGEPNLDDEDETYGEGHDPDED